MLWSNVNTGELDTWIITNGHLAGGSAISTASTGWGALTIATA